MGTKNILTYNDALQIVLDYLNTLKYGGLKVFCEENNISYNSVKQMKLDSNKPYYTIVSKILETIGYSNIHIEREYFFFVEVPNNVNNG